MPATPSNASTWDTTLNHLSHKLGSFLSSVSSGWPSMDGTLRVKPGKLGPRHPSTPDPLRSLTFPRRSSPDAPGPLAFPRRAVMPNMSGVHEASRLSVRQKPGFIFPGVRGLYVNRCPMISPVPPTPERFERGPNEPPYRPPPKVTQTHLNGNWPTLPTLLGWIQQRQRLNRARYLTISARLPAI